MPMLRCYEATMIFKYIVLILLLARHPDPLLESVPIMSKQTESTQALNFGFEVHNNDNTQTLALHSTSSLLFKARGFSVSLDILAHIPQIPEVIHSKRKCPHYHLKMYPLPEVRHKNEKLEGFSLLGPRPDSAGIALCRISVA